VQSGATINPNVRLKTGSTIKGLYPTIASAISNAASGQTVVVGSGTHYVAGDITLSSGITLDIKPSATVRFDGSYKIKVYGTLKAENANFTKSSSVSQWMGLYFYSGSDNSYLKNCSIGYARFGIYISNSDIEVYQCVFQNCILKNITVTGSSAEPTIEKCDIQDNCGTALFISNSANPIVKNNKFNSSDYSISIYNGYGSFNNNLISSTSGDGVYIYGSTSAPEFTSSQEGEGNLFDNCMDGSHVVIKGGNPNFGVWYYGDGGYNTFTRNFGNYYMENWTSTTISAQLNWWEVTTPPSSSFYGYNYIQWHPPLYYPPSSVGPLWKTNLATDPDIDEFIRISQMIKNHEFGNAISNIKLFNKENRGHILVHQILFELFSTIHKEDVADKQLEFMNYVISGDYDEPSKKVARGFLADYYSHRGNMAEAEQIVFGSPPGSLSERELLMDLITEYTFASDPANANRIADIMRSRHHDKDVEQDIKVALESFKDVAGNEDRPISITLPDDKIASISPNPFNLTTSISYSIAEPDRVEIQIFDILGREVRTLINNHQDVGLYSIYWNGKNNQGLELPSGIYIFTFKTKSAFLKTKLTFLK
jgi:parallel beta-helix repeat protein